MAKNNKPARHVIYHKRLKAEVISHYGGKCECCGEPNVAFLTIDHIDGGGTRHRMSVGGGTNLYSWAKRNNFPSGLQVLCFNCNCGRNANGGVCPHKAEDGKE